MVFSLPTERLILEDMNEGDREAVRRMARPDRQGYILAVRIPGTGDFAGYVLLEIDPMQPTTAEVGCILRPEYWKSGYASEILRALLAFAFGPLGLHRVYGKCDELNTASAHVMEKGGLVYEGTLRENVWLRDHWRSTRYYGMLADEYAARHNGGQAPACPEK